MPGGTTIAVTGEVKVPRLPAGTHPVALAWYRSLQQSGQSEYFEPSDWGALFVTTAMTKALATGKASLFGATWSAMESLLTTESARRRARIEVERAMAQPVESGDKVTVIDEYRRLLESSPQVSQGL